MNLVSSLFPLALAGAFCTGTSPEAQDDKGDVEAYAYEEQGWRVTCRPGDDGFAVNCNAEKPAGEQVFRLSAADSQLFVIIEDPKCRVEHLNFFRDDLFSLSAESRREFIAAAFRRIAGDMVAACPRITPEEIDFSYLPDIAVAPQDRAW